MMHELAHVVLQLNRTICRIEILEMNIDNADHTACTLDIPTHINCTYFISEGAFMS